MYSLEFFKYQIRYKDYLSLYKIYIDYLFSSIAEEKHHTTIILFIYLNALSRIFVWHGVTDCMTFKRTVARTVNVYNVFLGGGVPLRGVPSKQKVIKVCCTDRLLDFVLVVSLVSYLMAWVTTGDPPSETSIGDALPTQRVGNRFQLSTLHYGNLHYKVETQYFFQQF